jgi:glutathione S-transferase
MVLIGMFDSPFVRRVAISMTRLGMQFEHANWSVGKDFDQIRKHNPLGRVPTLVLDDGETLIESAMILDYLDDLVGSERALLPRSGAARRHSLRVMATASGAAEKGVSIVYERAFRPAEKRHQPWVDRCHTQVHGALNELNNFYVPRTKGAWLMGDTMTQADITTCCVFTFLMDALQLTKEQAPYLALHALVERSEALPEFQSTRLDQKHEATYWQAPDFKALSGGRSNAQRQSD